MTEDTGPKAPVPAGTSAPALPRCDEARASTAATRRAAYAWVAEAIDSMPDDPGNDVWREVRRIRDSMRAASEVVDEPGVEAHESGDGRAP